MIADGRFSSYKRTNKGIDTILSDILEKPFDEEHEVRIKDSVDACFRDFAPNLDAILKYVTDTNLKILLAGSMAKKHGTKYDALMRDPRPAYLITCLLERRYNATGKVSLLVPQHQEIDLHDFCIPYFGMCASQCIIAYPKIIGPHFCQEAGSHDEPVTVIAHVIDIEHCFKDAEVEALVTDMNTIIDPFYRTNGRIQGKISERAIHPQKQLAHIIEQPPNYFEPGSWQKYVASCLKPETLERLDIPSYVASL